MNPAEWVVSARTYKEFSYRLKAYMSGTFILGLWLSVLALLLVGCGGVPIPDICLDPKPCPEAVCRAGRWEGCSPPPETCPEPKPAPDCTCEAGAWKCPTPPPPANPTPVPGTPLAVAGNQFVPPILGSVTTHHGWPYIDEPSIDQIAGFGLNYTARRGPAVPDDRPGYDLFVRVPCTATAELRPSSQSAAANALRRRGVKIPAAVPCVDLTKFNPEHDARVLAMDQRLHEKGVFWSQGLYDGWLAVHWSELDLYWKAANNVNGVDIGTCADFRAPPHPVILSMVRHRVWLDGRYPGVIWELGNEANRCKPEDVFVDGVRNAVRAAEQEFGYVRHLWSPGTVDLAKPAFGSEYDYLSTHGSPQEPIAVPIDVNEYSPQTKDIYLQNLAIARQKGGQAYNYWHDDNAYGGAWEAPEWEREWTDVMGQMHAAPPTAGCSAIVDGPQAMKDDPRPPAVDEIAVDVNAVLQELTGCSPQSRCPVEKEMFAFYREDFLPRIRAKGWCAAIQDGADEVCIGPKNQGERGWCQGYKTAACIAGTNCQRITAGWAPGSHRDTWRGPIVEKEPGTPPPGTGCPRQARFNMVVRQQARTLVDATPLTCDTAWCHANGFPDRNCCPAGPEGQERPCEVAWGPYIWSLDEGGGPVECNGLSCAQGGNCFSNNNPLQYAFCKSGTAMVVGATSGVSSSIQVTVP